MTKIVYSYDPITGEYAGEVSCRLCPVTKSEWIIPAHTTDITPPDTDDGFCPVFNGNTWIIIEDFRGHTIYSIINGEEVGFVQTIDFELQDGQTLNKPPECTDGHKATWQDGAWIIKADHRGEIIYSTETGEEIWIESLGDYPENTTTQPRPDHYHIWNGREWEFNNQYLWVVVRQQRDALLHDSDWTESSRRLTPEQKQAWVYYRDALFDLPDIQSAAQTLADIIWPTPPSV